MDVFLEDDGWWCLLQLVLFPGQLLGWLLYPSMIYIIPNIPPAPWNFRQGEWEVDLIWFILFLK